MNIYGVALLAFAYLLGQWMGEVLGFWIGIDANVGGVGFAMIILMLLKDWFTNKNLFTHEMESGMDFWNKLYIPVVIAMAASLNVKSAVSAGTLAIAAGSIPVLLCFLVFPMIIKNFSPKNDGNTAQNH